MKPLDIHAPPISVIDTITETQLDAHRLLRGKRCTIRIEDRIHPKISACIDFFETVVDSVIDALENKYLE